MVGLTNFRCLYCQQGSRKMRTVGTCSQPIWDFGSHFWLAIWNSFRKKCPPAKMSYRKWRMPAKLAKSPKSMHKNYNYMFFFYNLKDRTWQPILVSSQPILDFLEPWLSMWLFPSKKLSKIFRISFDELLKVTNMMITNIL